MAMKKVSNPAKKSFQGSYWVLELRSDISRLYEALDGVLHELVTPEVDNLGNPLQGFPLDYPAPEDSAQTAFGKGDRDARYKDDNLKAFFEMVDRELGKVLTQQKLPVIVVGVVANVSAFGACTKHATSIIGYQHGDYPNTFELTKAVVPVIEQHMYEERRAVLEKLVKSADMNHQAFGMHRVWMMAQEGRIDTLVVEKDFIVPGFPDMDNPEHVYIFKDAKLQDGIENTVEALVAKVIADRGHVVVVDKDALKDFEHIAAILRY